MANGILGWFEFKSKETVEREQAEYAKWAFPYGEKQRENLQTLLLSLYPKKKKALPIMLMGFLSYKELYQNAVKTATSYEDIIKSLIKGHKRYRNLIDNKDLTTYIAIVLADAGIDERCEYPGVDEIGEKALEFEKYRGEK